MELSNKAMYIKGLADGLELDEATKEGKVISALLELVSDMAATIEKMQADMGELQEYVEELDEDLGDVEELLLGDDDEDDDDLCDGDCENCLLDCDLDDDDEDDDDDDDDYFEVVCPSCGDVINFDSSIDPENLRCPNCGQKFECIVDEDDLKALDGLDDKDED